MISKGIILAGGKGTRLGALTKAVNKQLLPIHDKPLIFYPLSILMLSGIKDILIIVNPGQIKNFKALLGNGSRFGIKIKYKEQKKPNGLPEAFKIGKYHIGKSNVALILGDNFFYGQGLSKILEKSKTFSNGAMVFVKQVKNPQDYGVALIKKNKINKIIEKPKKHISDYAITGLYYFDNTVVNFAKKLKPSKRGETEITDLIKFYKKNDTLSYEIIGRGALWSDAGKIEDLVNTGNYVSSSEKIQQLKIGCLEEISFSKKWIGRKQLKESIVFYDNSDYANYLRKIMKQTI